MSSLLQSNERSIRSVFVGNIPYDATEEKLKDIFNEVGPVVSFRLVYDRETGKPKGYGFCEYRDQETAMSAMRNLNGYELNNRILRVDNAANEKTKEEIRNLQTSVHGIFESPYGPEMDHPEQAPEEISKVVASLPPEQMFELAKQMKQCIASNPAEAKNMLIQNPQLCYGLLQALVVMRVVDPNVALKMLHRTNPPVKPLKLQDTVQSTMPPQIPNIQTLQPPQLNVPPQLPPNIAGSWATQTDQFGRTIPASVLQQQQAINQAAINPIGLAPANAFSNIPPPSTSVFNAPSTQPSFDPRMYNRMQNLPATNLDPRVRQQQNQPNNVTTNNAPNLDPRQYAQQQNAARTNNNLPNRNTGPSTTGAPQFNQMPSQLPPPPQQSNEDQERTELILRVLQLTDEQVNLLPPDQKASVLMLREKIHTSNNAGGN